MSEKAMTAESGLAKPSTSSVKDVEPKKDDKLAIPRNIPEEPYILYTPSDRPYRNNTEHENNWRIEGLFGSREEYLQYQSFVWRDSATSLFQLKAPHEIESQRREAHLNVPGSHSRPTTPLPANPAKKKITLSDYKNKTKLAGQLGAGTPSLTAANTPNSLSKAGLAESTKQATPTTTSNRIPAPSLANPVTVATNGDSKMTDAEPVPAPTNVDSTMTDQDPAPVAIKGDSTMTDQEPAPVAIKGDSTMTDQDPTPVATKADGTMTDQEPAPVAIKGDSTMTDQEPTPVAIKADSTMTDQGPAPVVIKADGTMTDQESAQQSSTTAGVDRALSKASSNQPTDEDSGSASSTETGTESSSRRAENVKDTNSAAVPRITEENTSPASADAKTISGPETSDSPPKLAAIPTVSVTEATSPMSKVSPLTTEAQKVEDVFVSPPWLFDQPSDNEPIASPPQAPKQPKLAFDVEDLDWVPDTSPWPDTTKLPPRLPDLPAWVDLSPRRHIKGVSGSPAESSSPDALSLSATYSQTSVSSVSSTDARRSASSKPVEKTQSAVNRHHASKPSTASENKPRPTNPASGRSEKKSAAASTTSAKTIKKLVKVNPSSSSFFSSLKPSGSPILRPTQPVPATEKLLVRLKYGKQQAKTVQRILQMKSTPKKAVDSSDNSTSSNRSTSTNSSTRHDADSKVKSQGKRLHPNDDATTPEPSAKRKRLDDGQAQRSPRTPTMQPARSPATATPSSTLQRQILTPKVDNKVLKAPVNAGTPRSNVATPNHGNSADPPRSASKPLSERGTGTHDIKALKAEQVKQSQIAIDLKRKMQAAMKPKQDSNGKDERPAATKEAAVDGVESIICFIRAFVVMGQYDRSPKTLVKGWESVLPLAKEVCNASQNFPHLHAISLMLQAACCSIVASFHPRIRSEDYASFGGESEFLKRVLGNLTKLQQHLSDAERVLPRATWLAEYPKSYKESQELGHGPFIKATVAARMGTAFLAEWTRKEKLPWKQRAEEGLCVTL